MRLTLPSQVVDSPFGSRAITASSTPEKEETHLEMQASYEHKAETCGAIASATHPTAWLTQDQVFSTVLTQLEEQNLLGFCERKFMLSTHRRQA